MGLRTWTILMIVFACASLTAAQSSSTSQSPSTLLALSTLQTPPAPQAPRVPGEPPRTPPTQPLPTSQPETPKANQLTVTGCIEQSQAQASTKKEPAPTGTSGKASGSAKGSKFILTNPKLSGAPSAASSSSSSSSSSSASSSSGWYQLDARDSKLSPHVGHQVEVTGTLKGSSSSSASSSDAPKLKVDNVRMISTSCNSSSSPPATPDAR
jgi:hypothetical protein